jgi:hypothetical protein
VNKSYDVFLDNIKIGHTELEKADAPMGVVFGKINLLNIASGYDFFKEYCSKKNIGFNDSPDEEMISTINIPGLQIFNFAGSEIKGISCSVSGMNSESFEIYVEGISYPFFENEFPNHVRDYHKRFNKLRQ